ncbi:hypothetical protein FHQ26_05515 [Testudinibacter sp. TR-2022]|uniref:hypothetical protein n=1 Tax=Testudinibacter sp. TR-2022 TaxID=2585029 RepID=UPI001118B12E|nr:hypothetical protein [Testudinibacter sp. TR-2022]TNH10233.1 hypothetical protein FHQ26_05515 [Testudinibacter sp. TR-2022]
MNLLLNDLSFISEDQAEKIVIPLVNILYRLNIQYTEILSYEVLEKSVHILEDENIYQLIFMREVRQCYFFNLIKTRKYRERYLKININKNAEFFKGIDDINNFTTDVQESKVKGIDFIPTYTMYSLNNEMAKDILLYLLRISCLSSELIKHSSTIKNINISF